MAGVTRRSERRRAPAPGREVIVEEPSFPRRIRRPSDALRFAISLGALGLILLLITLARGTTSGLQSDIVQGTAQTPHILLTMASLVSSFGVLVVPAAFAMLRLFQREGLRVAVAVLAAGVAVAVTLALDEWASGRTALAAFLIWPQRGVGAFPGPAHIDLTPVIAFVTAIRLTGRPRWQMVTWGVVALDALAALAAGYVSAFALVTTYIIGRAIGYGTLYVVGGPNTRPPGLAVAAALRRVGLAPVRILRLPDGPEERRYHAFLGADHGGDLPGAAANGSAGAADDGRNAVSDDARPGLDAHPGPQDGAGDGERGTGQDDQRAGGDRDEGGSLAPDGMVDVTVLDRDRQAAGLLSRVWRRVRLRGPAIRHTVRSPRRSLEQEALMAYAAGAAGVRTPRLIATSEVETEAALLAYAHLPARPLSALPDEEITDELLADVWEQVRLLQTQRLAHRNLDGESILVADGRVYLTDLRTGEIAASDLLLRLDLAQLLTSLALRVGPERAVSTAATTIGIDELTASVPLLQRVALNQPTRMALRRDGSILTRLREQVLSRSPRTEPEPVRLERFRLRNLVSMIIGTAAVYLLLSQLSHLDLRGVIVSADWRWALGALAAAIVCYFAAALMLIGYVPERLPLGRTMLVQLAGSFLKLVAPATVSAVAVNTRFLQRSGIPPGQAVASVGASQLGGLVFHIMLLATFGFITGTTRTPSLPPSRAIVTAVVAVAVLAIVVTAVPRLRRLVVTRARSVFAGVVPRLLDVLQSPKKLCTGLGGTLLLTIAFVACLDACVRAFGGSLDFSTVAVVFMAGNALGSAAPTPGGLGAVEGALTLGLTLSGLPAGTATSAVLLFRLLTFWLPVLPGWAAFTYLQRKEVI
jgi:glycosyltransferase 2 family protein